MDAETVRVGRSSDNSRHSGNGIGEGAETKWRLLHLSGDEFRRWRQRWARETILGKALRLSGILVRWAANGLLVVLVVRGSVPVVKNMAGMGVGQVMNTSFDRRVLARVTICPIPSFGAIFCCLPNVFRGLPWWIHVGRALECKTKTSCRGSSPSICIVCTAGFYHLLLFAGIDKSGYGVKGNRTVFATPTRLLRLSHARRCRPSRPLLMRFDLNFVKDLHLAGSCLRAGYSSPNSSRFACANLTPSSPIVLILQSDELCQKSGLSPYQRMSAIAARGARRSPLDF